MNLLRAVALGTACVSSLAHASVSAGPTPGQDRPPSESVYRSRGPLGPVHPGVLVGVGAPDGVHVGVTVRAFGWLGGGLQLATIPEVAVPGIQNASLVRVSGEGYVRAYPFRGPFFLGVGLGAMQMKGSITQSVTLFRQSQQATAHAYAHSIYLAPQMGFLWTTRSGVSFGSHIGVQLPLSPTEPTFDAQKYGLTVPVDGKGSLASAMRILSSTPIPVLDILSVGFVL